MELSTQQSIRLEAAGMVTKHLLPFLSEHSGDSVAREAAKIADFIEKGEGNA